MTTTKMLAGVVAALAIAASGLGCAAEAEPEPEAPPAEEPVSPKLTESLDKGSKTAAPQSACYYWEFFMYCGVLEDSYLCCVCEHNGNAGGCS
jgi:hypothetical protein